jgi:hypothetical protein
MKTLIYSFLVYIEAFEAIPGLFMNTVYSVVFKKPFLKEGIGFFQDMSENAVIVLLAIVPVYLLTTLTNHVRHSAAARVR